MPKLTYVLFKTGLPHHIPHGLTGRSGKLYGHAMYEARYAGHVIRVEQGVWERGADRDILERVNRSSQNWIVRAEAEADTEGAEAELAQALDAALAENRSLKDQLETAGQNVRPSPLEMPEAEEKPVADYDQNIDVSTIVDTQSTLENEAVSSEKPDLPVSNERTQRASEFDDMGFRDLRDIALTLNKEKGANIDLKRIKTKDTLIDAMLSAEFPQ